jgi:hypothetical protein
MLAFGKRGDELDCKMVEEKRSMCQGRKKGQSSNYKSIPREWRDFQTSKRWRAAGEGAMLNKEGKILVDDELDCSSVERPPF